ncbi:MAG TPA: 2OG-Fe(II) oxygenase [Solirubrobacteraceae bacterium]|nr:2OG-Fe(II) oxygenase [Solirubrobacteraceae bacterium]
MTIATTPTVADRIADLDWPSLTAQLDDQGFAQTPPVYTAADCRELAASFNDGRFRSTIDMRRYRFGEGEYKYFDAPLPALIDGARHALYPPLAELANEWAHRLGEPTDFPADLDAFLERCHRAGQRRPTPLILRYTEGGHNTLHQDIYGDVAFPVQAVTVLDRPGADFEGGEFVLLEQRPRAQSRAHVIELQRGAFLIFSTRHRPVRGTRGYYRANMRHGVATVRSGQRTTLGVIFHDAS